MNSVKTVYKNKTNNKVIGVTAIINNNVCNINIKDLIRSNLKFDNAIVCNNGVIRGKNGCKLNFQYDNSNVITLYHGSPKEKFTPLYGKGEDKHDYGKGFYLTKNPELAKEWAISVTNRKGYLHTYSLDLTGLNVLNFNKESSLAWLAELMKHRDADSSARYRRLSKQFIDLFGIDISSYDVIYGWRADSSYFAIAKRFVRNEIDYDLISELFHLGELENQICLKSRKAFAQLKEIKKSELVDLSYGEKYMSRDTDARNAMTNLISSSRNTMKRGFDYVINKKLNGEVIL